MHVWLSHKKSCVTVSPENIARDLYLDYTTKELKSKCAILHTVGGILCQQH